MRIEPIILLVEDSEDDVLLVKRAFRIANATCRLEVVTDGQEAIDYILGVGAFGDRNHFPLPDLVLLDLKMPKRGGFEVLNVIRAQSTTKETLVIVLSSSTEPKDMDQAYQRGANDYISKPTNFDLLVAFVKHLKVRWLDLTQTPS